ncbi:MAG: DUF3341 domain-containing protein [Bacteroidia bacterium]|nr:DUF3341 domain-containing protein [Bacteroidia bacterium]MDW8015598.1 DUF3341 domain-containing protein [Bacteroidia bacterium]
MAKYLVGLYNDEEKLLAAVTAFQQERIPIHEVCTPFPVHGLDQALGLRKSRLPDAAFVYGALGTLTALSMQIYMYTIDWPTNIGGKSSLPFPSFIPITFELTVLFAGVLMFLSYLYVNRLYPGRRARVYDRRQTDDSMVIAIADERDWEAAKRLFQKTGAFEMKIVEL